MSILAQYPERLSSLTDEIEKITEETDFDSRLYLRELSKPLDAEPEADLDRDLTMLNSLAEELVRDEIELPNALADAQNLLADKLIEQTPDHLHSQMGALALADVFHFTNNQDALDSALKAIAHRRTESDISEYAANAIQRVAMKGVSVSESMRHGIEQRDSLADTSRISSETNASQDIHIPLGSEYEYLYDASLPRPQK